MFWFADKALSLAYCHLTHKPCEFSRAPLYVKTGTEMLADSCQNSLLLLQISLKQG